MLKHCLRRFGLWPVVAGVTLISILVSMAIVAAVHRFILGEPLSPAAVWLGIVVARKLDHVPRISGYAYARSARRADAGGARPAGRDRLDSVSAPAETGKHEQQANR